MDTKISNDNASLKILIAYYTRTGNTENFAKQIKNHIGGDLFRIEEANKYPLRYQDVLKVSKVEIDNQIKPPIKGLVENIDQYEIIFIGTPNWYGTMAPPVATFLSKHNLSEKKLIPFATHGGGGEQRCLTDISQMCSQSTVLQGLALYGSHSLSSDDRIFNWLKLSLGNLKGLTND